MSASNWVHLDVTKIHQESEKAFLLEIDGGELTWIPKSQISEPETLEAGDVDVTVSITEWIAEQKGIG